MTTQLLLFFLLACTLQRYRAQNETRRIVNGCPERFFRYDNKCSFGSYLPETWTDAEKMCNKLGTLMVMIKNQTQYDQMMNSSENSILNIPGSLHMGLKFTIADKTWRWSDGYVFNPAEDWAIWYDGQPPEEPTQDMCMALQENDDTLKFKMIHCYESGFVMCYENASTEENMCPSGYSYMQLGPLCTSSLMKLDDSWNRGAKMCNERGGAHIMMVKDPLEMDIINNGEHMDLIYVGIWMGLKYWAAEGEWKYVDGQRFNFHDDWAVWKDGKAPSEKPKTDRCIILERDGPDSPFGWVDEDCDADLGLVFCAKFSEDADEQLLALLNGTGDRKLLSTIQNLNKSADLADIITNSHSYLAPIMHKLLKPNQSTTLSSSAPKHKQSTSKSKGTKKVKHSVKPTLITVQYDAAAQSTHPNSNESESVISTYFATEGHSTPTPMLTITSWLSESFQEHAVNPKTMPKNAGPIRLRLLPMPPSLVIVFGIAIISYR